MTQVLPAALVAPTQVSLSADAVGYLIRTIAGVEGSFVSNTGTAGAISKVASTGYFYATTGITAPDDGGVLEWYISNAGVKSTFLSAVAIEPAPNQADQAAGIRAALGLASANVDTQLTAINSKTTNLPAAPAAVGDIPTTTQIWTHATRALTDKDNFNLASSQSFSTTGSVGSVTGAVGSVTGAVTVGTLNSNVITANAIAADAVAEIQNGLATASSIYTPAQIATAVEAALIAEGDGQKLLEAIQGAVQQLFDTNTDVPIATLVGAIADRITADHGTGSYTTANLSAIALQTTLEEVRTKTNALPGDPADQSELAQLIAAIPQGLTTQQNTRLTQLWQQAGFDSAVPVVRDKEGSVITETLGTTVITHTVTNNGDTVTTERQP